MTWVLRPPGAAPDHEHVADRFARLNDRLGHWALWLSGLGLLVMTAITGWQVFGRYVMNDSPQWVERIALLLVLYFSFLAGAVGVREESHLGIAFVNDALPSGLRRAVMVVVGLILAAFGACWSGTASCSSTKPGTSRRRSSAFPRAPRTSPFRWAAC